MSSKSLSEFHTAELIEQHRFLDRVISKMNRMHTCLLPSAQEEQRVNKVRRLRLRDELAHRAAHGNYAAQLYLRPETLEGYRGAA